MFAICYLMSVGGRVRSYEKKIEMSNGRLPDYIMVPGEVIDRDKFDPRANWDGWVSGIDNANVTNTRCERFAGVTYIDAKVLNKFMTVILVAHATKSAIPPPGSKIVDDLTAHIIEKRRREAGSIIKTVYNYNSVPMEWMEITSDKD